MLTPARLRPGRLPPLRAPPLGGGKASRQTTRWCGRRLILLSPRRSLQLSSSLLVAPGGAGPGRLVPREPCAPSGAPEGHPSGAPADWAPPLPVGIQGALCSPMDSGCAPWEQVVGAGSYLLNPRFSSLLLIIPLCPIRRAFTLSSVTSMAADRLLFLSTSHHT
jgi:hypothetical protein